MSTQRSIVHVTTHYHPVNGGQQIYIENLIRGLPEYRHLVVQLDNGRSDAPAHVEMLRVGFPWNYKALAFYGFNLRLRKSLGSISHRHGLSTEHDIVLCHYAFHLPAVHAFRNVIAVSHGVEWDGPGSILRKAYHAHRRHINRSAVLDPAQVVVANDVNFYRSLGLPEVDSRAYFSEVRRHKWLLPNCIDLARYRREAPATMLLPPFSIIIPRNIVRQRGMDVVIDAFAKFRSETGDRKHRLYLVGAPYDPDYARELEQQIERLGLQEWVVFHAPVPSAQTPALYNSAALTIIFSLFREGTSLAAIESMACGTPVISSDIGGLRELPTLKATRETLHTVMTDALARRDELGAAQQAQVRRTYDAARWLGSWRDILSQPSHAE